MFSECHDFLQSRVTFSFPTAAVFLGRTRAWLLRARCAPVSSQPHKVPRAASSEERLISWMWEQNDKCNPSSDLSVQAHLAPAPCSRPQAPTLICFLQKMVPELYFHSAIG
ncbi:unnamed protein product [Gulo gulo]|uniref:Uncharacterized protein n=1 Tax=Gulo gulo TaxID=48420 RepID=A0A9X9PUT9_GULGU|nr:unnamed protein product [Gulo gulo]